MKWRILAAASVIAATPLMAADPVPGDMAERFGALDTVIDISLSPDGKQIAYVSPGPDRSMIVMTADIATGASHAVTQIDAKVGHIGWCAWSAADRLVCQQRSQTKVYGDIGVNFTRLFAIDLDGKNVKMLGQRSSDRALGISLADGNILDWGTGDGTVLMAKMFIPERAIGTLVAEKRDGLGVQLINTRTLQARNLEIANRQASGYISDGRGKIRIMWANRYDTLGNLTGETEYFYRKSGSNSWATFSRSDRNGENAFVPIAVDAECDCAYATRRSKGRRALYSVALNDTLDAKQVFSHADVDVDDVVRIGRRGRVIGASYVTEERHATYFDKEYGALAEALTKALPGQRLIGFVDASADEKQLLILATSDVDPGRYYLFDRTSKTLAEVLLRRPPLEKVQLANVRAVNYRADDGTMVPAYLTLPVNGAAKGLPTLVMPHGGPASRDEWGFDWLAQYFAQRGWAVLQPNFRGSSGYGQAWFQDNGFQSWRRAIGDVTSAGKWLVSEGIADPRHLAILGWSYGGYAALQAQVVAPDLFKAAVAIAPVTDLAMLKAESKRFTNAEIVARYIGSGAHIDEGSPARHADAFKAPVLMFHGSEDLNVDATESKEMDRALRKAGKASTLVIYDGLDHQLRDSKARIDMLLKSDAFLRGSVGL
ncbi:alpha/beta fold hydrolase [Sphingomonas flavalba]|uniref:S9 family peptidase n=1 Tax=Sphingomonas flavalba TaxID=2559804 RepID=UPI0039E1090D